MVAVLIATEVAVNIDAVLEESNVTDGIKPVFVVFVVIVGVKVEFEIAQIASAFAFESIEKQPPELSLAMISVEAKQSWVCPSTSSVPTTTNSVSLPITVTTSLTGVLKVESVAVARSVTITVLVIVVV